MKRGPKQITNEKFIEKANKKHNNYYDYSLVNYINSKTKVKIICPKHGIFEQQPSNHVYGQRCIWCMGDNVRKARISNTEEFIVKAKLIHGDRYDYSITEYSRCNYKLIINCRSHGKFLQCANSHLGGAGCPLCISSRRENIIELFLIENKIPYIREHKFIECFNPKTNKKLPFDFFIPKNNLIIEYQGEQHYKKTGFFESRAGGLQGLQYRDKIKKNYCSKNKINYLEISYKEINNIEKILKEKICV